MKYLLSFFMVLFCFDTGWTQKTTATQTKLIGTWKILKVNDEEPKRDENITLIFGKKDVFSMTDGIDTRNGTWKLSSDAKNIIVDGTGEFDDTPLNIIALKKKQLKMERNGYVAEFKRVNAKHTKKTTSKIK
jgi:hypothetical protein